MSRIFMHTFDGFKKRISNYRFDESLCVKVGDQKVKKNSKLLQYISICLWKNIYSVPLFFFQKKTFSGSVLFVEYIHTNKTGKNCPNLDFFQEKSV